DNARRGSRAWARESDAIDFYAIHDHNLLNLRLGNDGENLVDLNFGRNKNHATASIVQKKSGLLGRERGIERNRHRAEQQRRHIRDRPLRPVLAEDGDAIALADAAALQGPRRANRGSTKLLRRHRQPRAALAMQHGPFEIALDRGEENIVESGKAHVHVNPFPTLCRITRCAGSVGPIHSSRRMVASRGNWFRSEWTGLRPGSAT